MSWSFMRELTGDDYLGTSKGIDTVDGARVGYKNMIYGESEIDRIARVAGKFEVMLTQFNDLE